MVATATSRTGEQLLAQQGLGVFYEVVTAIFLSSMPTRVRNAGMMRLVQVSDDQAWAAELFAIGQSPASLSRVDSSTDISKEALFINGLKKIESARPAALVMLGENKQIFAADCTAMLCRFYPPASRRRS